MSPQLEISTFLAAIRKRWRWLAALRAGSSAVAGVAVALGVLALAVRLARPTADAVMAIAVLAMAAAIAWVVRAVRPTMAVVDDSHLARLVEERRPEFEDALVAAVHVRDGGHAFAPAILADAAVRAREVDPSSIVRSSDLRRAAGRGLAACGLLLVTGGASLAPLERAVNAAWMRLFPSRVALAVEPGDTRIVAGRSLTLRARVTGVPAGFDASPFVTIESSTRPGRQAMRRDSESYVLTLPSVTDSFRYGVSAAGIRSASYTVTVLHRPALQRIDVAYQYPAYTGMPARVEEDGGDIYAPAGTRVTVRVRASKRVASGTLKMGARAIALAPGQEPEVRETSFEVQHDGSYRVDLTDVDGLQSEPSAEYFVRVTDDRPPEVRIVRPEGDRQVTPLEEVEIEALAEDDYRLGALELVYAVGAQPGKVVTLSRGGRPSAAGGHLLFLEDLKVRPGDIVSAYARAREARRGGREARSEMLLLEVAPFDQEFSLAQSQAAAGGGGGDLDSLIQAQKNILNATWNLLRRAAAGRSDADVKAVAAAQGDVRVRARAQAQAGGARRAARDGGDPMALAVAAMGRAEEALRRRKLQDAVPHEMEALSQLGRVLAENRRREVSQQRGAGGGGGNRTNQDLSALFDRELLRQQQTNYENRQSTSERRDASGDDELQKRIRELAARQDELARAQRQLAAQRMSEEERRRRLERLTREQEELRRQAEQLARDLQRQQQGGGQSREQSESVREAAEEMRGSSGEMRRNNAESASERGSRAAERLRGAEQSSQRRQGQQLSAGELQMEAQQLADAQRRLEAQQRETESQGAQGNQSRRRLADEQERLADRTERLERSARALAGGGGEQRQQQAAEQAARDLQRQRVAERMRENAHGLRQPQPSPRSGERAVQLSSALQRAAERLSATGDAETRRLASEMARNRAARERIEEMSRRLERAQRDGKPGGQEELRREMQRAEQTLRDLQRGGRPASGIGDSTPERHEWSESAPGLESFKQDFSRWEQLKRDLTLALEQRDLAIAQRLRGRRGEDTISAGSVEALPEAYRAKVARYFEALARAGRRNP